ncbi:MAG TPA: SUF system NifU family Fe-S cluster assembly protein [Candidatus Nanoarchaeia archaeon]|nr:SUF system NifU family Fe-S cluster assembly protein [Candidatus Nanoarchaeia archaeon]
MDAMDQMYHENILDHYKHPHNFGELKDASVHHHEHNPLCGDTLDLYLVIKGGKIVEVKYTGKGCAISQASASMLTDEIKGKTLSEIERMSKENILEMLGITLSPIRLKCALLSLDTVKNSIHIYRNYVNKGTANNGKFNN